MCATSPNAPRGETYVVPIGITCRRNEQAYTNQPRTPTLKKKLEMRVCAASDALPWSTTTTNPAAFMPCKRRVSKVCCRDYYAWC